MYLFHNGVVRESAKGAGTSGRSDGSSGRGMEFSYDEKKSAGGSRGGKEAAGNLLCAGLAQRGRLSVGEDIMLVLLGGDTRPMW